MFISHKKFEDLKKQTDDLVEQLEQASKLAVLIGIERVGRENIFTFMRGDKKITIKTMGLLSDNLPQWKDDLLR